MEYMKREMRDAIASPPADQQATTTPPRGLSIADVVARSGVGRTKVYEAIGNGELVARKFGERTLIFEHDLTRWMNSFPVVPSRKREVV
jgi:excisionase family DNA binding protein